MPQRAKQLVMTIIKFGVAVLLIYWMISKGMLNLSSLKILATPTAMIFCFGIIFIQFTINNYRWAILLRGVKFVVSARKLLGLSFIGIFFNFAVPGGVGGDVVKGYYLIQDFPNRKMQSAMSILMDRVIGMYAMVTMGLASFFLDFDLVLNNKNLIILLILVIGLFAGMSLFFALAFSRRFYRSGIVQKIFSKLPGSHILLNVYEAVHVFGANRTIFIGTILMSLFSQSLIVAFMVYVAHLMGAHVTWLTYFFVVPLGLISTVLPISPAGIGVGQAAFYYLFKVYTGTDSQLGPNTMTAYQVVTLAWGFVGAYLYVTQKKPKPEELAEVGQEI